MFLSSSSNTIKSSDVESLKSKAGKARAYARAFLDSGSCDFGENSNPKIFL